MRHIKKRQDSKKLIKKTPSLTTGKRLSGSGQKVSYTVKQKIFVPVIGKVVGL